MRIPKLLRLAKEAARVGREDHSPIVLRTTVRPRHLSSGLEIAGIHLCWPWRHNALARAASRWLEHGEPLSAVAVC